MPSIANPFRRVVSLLLTLIALAVTTTPSPAGIILTDIIGGPGGQKFVDTCGGTSAITAINYILIEDLFSVGPVCQQMLNSHPSGPLVGLGTWGNTDIKNRKEYEGQLRCAPGMVVDGLTVKVSTEHYVMNFVLICTNIDTHEHASTYYAPSAAGKAEDYTKSVHCGENGWAIGVIGRWGSRVDGLGLYCIVSRSAEPLNTPPPAKPIKHTARGGPTTAPPDKPPIKVLNGDDADQNADNGDDGGAGGATAATDTTIYDQPDGSDVAYLSGGDPVTIVSCNDDNWCRISKPQNGWVWGDDLDR